MTSMRTHYLVLASCICLIIRKKRNDRFKQPPLTTERG